MDNLEKVYYGVGSGYYDMPENYVVMGKLCVAVFEMDNNWHRCRIIGVDLNKKKARVDFIDYGGDAVVPINGLKFLLKEFSFMPPQAIDSCFSRIRSRPDELWRKDTVNYMLNRLMNKKLKSKVTGIRGGFVSLEIYDKTLVEVNGRPAGTLIHINKKMVVDGYADFYNEENDPVFLKFDDWKEQTELYELERMFSRKNIYQSNSEVITAPLSEVSSFCTMNNSNLKDMNNNNSSSTSQKSTKIEYKLVDELKEDSVLKEKTLKINVGEKENVLFLLWLDKKRLIHSSQVFDLCGLSDDLVPLLFKNESSFEYFSKRDDILITKFLNEPHNSQLYEWLFNRLGLNLEDERETYFIVYENLLKFIKLVASPTTYKQINDAINASQTKKKTTQIQ